MQKIRFQKFLEYKFIGVRTLAVFMITLSKAAIIYFFIDLFTEFYIKYQADKDKDLSTKEIEKITHSQKKSEKDVEMLRKDQEKMRKDQEKYFSELKTKKRALKLLSKLISEGLIRGKDLLALSGSADYYQLFVYSVSPGRLISRKPDGSKLLPPNRKYPHFLQKLGFARLGKHSSFYLINRLQGTLFLDT